MMWMLARSCWMVTIGCIIALAGCDRSERNAPQSAAPAATGPPAPPVGTPFTREAEAASNSISASQIGEWIRTLASDEFEGRAPGSAGDEKARRYLAQ
jgi:hypothetical protein